MAIILDGKKLANSIKQTIAEQTRILLKTQQIIPHLAIILVGEDPASQIYIQHKIKACNEVGFKTTYIQEDAQLKEEKLISIIQALNMDIAIHGIIVQLPLPKHIRVHNIMQSIYPYKDVDGLHPYNYGKIGTSSPGHVPATPLGISLLLSHYNIPTVGKHCVIVGRSLTVGAPLSILMSRYQYPGNSTVTLCHSQTQNLGSLTCQADILVVAAGTPRLITSDMVKKNATVIDVGITRIFDSKKRSGYALQGDIDFDLVAPICSHITPVPGGVGPMTIVALLSNTLRTAIELNTVTSST